MKLVKFAETSDMMNIEVVYGTQTFKFNLDEELRIDESAINKHIKGHVRSYAFLSMLYVKLKIKQRDQGRVIKRIYNNLIAEYKPKYKTITEAEAVMRKESKKLREAEDLLGKIEEQHDLIGVAVRSFEARKDLLQSLSANTRKETN